jgi:hypothetical protein
VVRDVAAGAVTDTIDLPSADDGIWAGWAVLVGDVLVTAARDLPRGAEINGYRLHPLRPVWSTRLPVALDLGLSGCGPLLCLLVDGGSTLIDPRSGLLGPHVRDDVVGRLGADGLVAVPWYRPGEPAAQPAVYILDSTSGLARATYLNGTVVEWPGEHGRALVMQQGEQRTVFTIVDRDGRPAAIRGVDGTNLNCAARGTILVCSAPGGLLRAWRLPS